MSEAIDPKQPVTIGQLGEILKKISATFNDALQKRDQQNEARFNQFAQVLQQVVDKVNQAPEKGGPLANLDKTDVINKFADRVMAKLFGDDDDPHNDPIFQTYKENVVKFNMMGIKIANQGMANLLRKEVRNPDIIKQIAGDMVERDMNVSSHGPI